MNERPPLSDLERLTSTSSVKLRQFVRADLKRLGIPQPIVQIVCNSNGILDYLYFSQCFPDNEDYFRGQTLECARKKLTEEQIPYAFQLAYDYFDSFQNGWRPNPQENSNNQPTPEKPRKRTEKRVASFDIGKHHRYELIAFATEKYFTHPSLDHLKKIVGPGQFAELQRLVIQVIKVGETPADGEIRAETVNRHVRDIVAWFDHGRLPKF